MAKEDLDRAMGRNQNSGNNHDNAGQKPVKATAKISWWKKLLNRMNAWVEKQRAQKKARLAKLQAAKADAAEQRRIKQEKIDAAKMERQAKQQAAKSKERLVALKIKLEKAKRKTAKQNRKAEKRAAKKAWHQNPASFRYKWHSLWHTPIGFAKRAIVILLVLLLVGFIYIGWGNPLIDRPWSELTLTQQAVIDSGGVKITSGGVNITEDIDLGDWQKLYWLGVVLYGIAIAIYLYRCKDKTASWIIWFRAFVQKTLLEPLKEVVEPFTKAGKTVRAHYGGWKNMRAQKIARPPKVQKTVKTNYQKQQKGNLA